MTIGYVDGRPSLVDTVLVSAQHAPQVDQSTLTQDIAEVVVEPLLREIDLAGLG